MQANLAPEIQIKETDQEFYHVEFTRLVPMEEGPSRPMEVKDVQVYTSKAWGVTKALIDQKGLSFLNYHEHRIVHNPTKPETKSGPKAKPQSTSKK